MNVYIVWDHDRQEHGEAAELEDVFFSKESAEAYVESEDCWSTDATIEEREVKGSMSDVAVMEFISYVLSGTRPGMRAVIGDSTPEQYDRADKMAEAIANGVRRAMRKLGYIEEEAGEQEAEGA